MLWFYFHYRFTQLMFYSSCIRWFVSRFSSNLVHHIPIQSISILYKCTQTHQLPLFITCVPSEMGSMHSLDLFLSIYDSQFQHGIYFAFHQSTVSIAPPVCACVCMSAIIRWISFYKWKIERYGDMGTDRKSQKQKQ